jgi:flagellar biosynthetic protein FlhB
VATDAGGSERTERATPRKRHETRMEGRTVLSPDLVVAFVFFTAAFLLTSFVPAIASGFGEIFAAAGSRAAVAKEQDLVGAAVVRGALLDAARLVLPFALVLFAVVLALEFAQAGFHVSTKPLAPKLTKLDPLNGAKKLFSAQGAATLLFSLAKVGAIGFVVWRAIHGQLDGASALVDASPADLSAALGETSRRSILAAAASILVIAVFDYAWRKHRHEKSIMMTKHEVEEEMKSTEGDPKIRRRVRAAQRRLLNRQMMRDVKKADVVVTNPHRVAVALAYDRRVSTAPRVLAKGLNRIADRIRQEARAAGVPIVENRPLARALYRLVDVGGEIPEKLYVAAAELLAAVYRARRRAVS